MQKYFSVIFFVFFFNVLFTGISFSNVNSIWVIHDSFDYEGNFDPSKSKWNPWSQGDSSATFNQTNEKLQASLSVSNWAQTGLDVKSSVKMKGIQAEISLENSTINNCEARIQGAYWSYNGNQVTCSLSVTPTGINWFLGYTPDSSPQSWTTTANGTFLNESTMGKTYTVKLYFDQYKVNFEVVGKAQSSHTVSSMAYLATPYAGLHIISHEQGSITAKYDNVQIYVSEHETDFTYSSLPCWTAEGPEAGSTFGGSVSTAGDVNGDGYDDVIVGAPYDEDVLNTAGRAFVYHGSSSGLSSTYNWMAEGENSNDFFGGSVSTAGDVNGDGYDDIIVGAEHYSDDQHNEGCAYVYYGSASGLSSTANWKVVGLSVSTAGDVNNDGYDDVIVGAEDYSNGQTFEGRAFVYHGSALGLSSTSNWTAESNHAFACFGESVSTAGDVNGDGFSDVIVGAPYGEENVQTAGRAFVYHGSSSGLSSTYNWMAEGENSNDFFGGSVSTAGDVNGDGYDDIIVGAEHYSDDQHNEGCAYVYYGSASGLSSTANWKVVGLSVSTAGDVNNDGYDDVIVGAEDYSNGQTFEGRAFVYHGSASGLSSTANWTAESNHAFAYFGGSVSTAGDVNNDKYDDVIVGASCGEESTENGRAFVYCGSDGDMDLTYGILALQIVAGIEPSRTVNTVADVNGDNKIGMEEVIHILQKVSGLK